MESTCWTLVRGAAEGQEQDRSLFARTYLGVVRAYLTARWRGGPLLQEVDDAVQETFVECFRESGALTRADPEKPGRFRTFLYAVVRNVARRFEQKRGRDRDRTEPEEAAAAVTEREEGLSRVFDRAWATALIQRAAERQAAEAESDGPEAKRRVELMRLRFGSDLPIREIAERWEIEPSRVHHEYARAREEFKAALLAEVAFHHPGATPGAVERECASLLALLG